MGKSCSTYSRNERREDKEEGKERGGKEDKLGGEN